MPHEARTANIESIDLWKNNPMKHGSINIARINFKFPCTWTTLTILELKELLSKWIECEEMRYPQSKGYRGRWMLFDEIKKVFDEKEVK